MSPRFAACTLGLVVGAGCGAGSTAPPIASTPTTALAPIAPSPPATPATASVVAPAASPPASGPAAASDFARIRDEALDVLLADSPSVARDLGLHEYDGRVAPLSAAGIAERIDKLHATERALAAVRSEPLGPEDALDRAELQHWVAGRLFYLVDLDAPHKLPQAYEEPFEVNVYIDRDYAPLERRAAQLVAQEEAALGEVVHARENLTVPLSKPIAEVAARNFAGFASYLRGDVVKVFGAVGEPALRARFAKANTALSRRAEELAAWLKKESPRGDQSHLLGPNRFRKLLEVQEGLSIPLDAFERMNEDDLAENRRAYEALAQTAVPRPVEEAKLFATAAHMMGDAKAFISAKAIVTLPNDDHVVVRETPPYERWNSASIDMSGPFEPARSAFYQLTIPDRSWPAAKRAEYLGSLGDLLGTTIHEVFPGHFVQGRWAERAPTRVQKAFGNYAFVEGWAHYSEQMMIDEGFGAEDPANRLAMLHGALLRNCRFAASVGMHARGMSLEAAEERFVHDCHQDRPTAHEQAVRGTFDPGYFAYTLGKLQILSLRAEARAKLGPAFSLQRFHDALLAHGAPPVALIHDRVLHDLGLP